MNKYARKTEINTGKWRFHQSHPFEVELCHDSNNWEETYLLGIGSNAEMDIVFTL